MPRHRFDPDDVAAKESELRARIAGAEPLPPPSRHAWVDAAKGYLIVIGLALFVVLVAECLGWLQ